MLAVAGLTVTDATGTGDTVIAAVPLCPSLVAVIVAVPAATPETRPPPLTIATARLLLDQETVRPVSTLPAESFVVAVSCAVWPTNRPAEAGLSVTEATGTTLTVIAAVPLLPSLVAVIVAEPAATAVTRPVADTVAMPEALVVHVTARPVSTLPAESLVVAASCCVCPTTRPAEAGVTVTDATGTMLTVMVAVPLLPSLVAVIVADPAATAVTRPLADTVAMPKALVVHVTARPVNTLPAESFVVAVNWRVWPTNRPAEAGVIVTEATGTTLTVIAAV